MNEKENAFILTGDVKALQSPPFQLLNLLYYSMKIKMKKNGCMNTIILILTIIKDLC